LDAHLHQPREAPVVVFIVIVVDVVVMATASRRPPLFRLLPVNDDLLTPVP
jgi:hypothetical protein